jgi:hypothetical protein
MPYVDLCKNVLAVKTVTYIAGHDGYIQGVPDNMTDGNLSTYYGIYSRSNYPWRTTEMQITFPSATLQNISITFHQGPNNQTTDRSIISLLSNGVWVDIFNAIAYGVDGIVTKQFTGKWNGVTAIKHSLTQSYTGYRTSTLTSYWYDVQCLGYLWSNIGLYEKEDAGIITIPVSTLDSGHKLRICKSGIVYGIDLLTTTDTLASNVQILSGGVVKALPKM